MKITIIGYGKMGKEIEKVLLKRGHEIAGIIDNEDQLKELKNSDNFCIDFTAPDALKNNYEMIADKFNGAIVGTTGWNDISEKVINTFKSKSKPFVYASNFSVGVNVFFDLVERGSELLSKLKDYDPYILEMHHKEKKDSPSGTAVTTKEIINKFYNNDISIASIRSGNIKGIHEAGFESQIDKISIKHEAYSREGFALGAVLAAEWLEASPGIYNFRELLKKMIS